MGQAKRRGTYEERRAAAIERANADAERVKTQPQAPHVGATRRARRLPVSPLLVTAALAASAMDVRASHHKP